MNTSGAVKSVERYHAPMRIAYKKAFAEMDRQTSDQEFFHLVVFAVSCMAGPQDLCRVVLVFELIRALARELSLPSRMGTAEPNECAIEAVAKDERK